MSSQAIKTLGVAFVFFTIVFIISAFSFGDSSRGRPIVYIFFAFSAFCVNAALACFIPQSRPITVRIIGAVICGLFVANAVNQHWEGNVDQGIKGFVIFGIPGAYIMVTGEPPFWGWISRIFKPVDVN